MAHAYEERKKEFNLYFEARIKDPTHEKSLRRVWDATFGKELRLPLLAVQERSPRKHNRYFIDTSKNDLVFQTFSTLDA